MNTDHIIIIVGLLALLSLSLIFEKMERKSRGKGTWYSDRMLLRLSGFVLGAAFTAFIFALLA